MLKTWKPARKSQKLGFILLSSNFYSSNPYERYDPTKSDHAKLEVQLEEKRSTKKTKKDGGGDSDSSESDSDGEPLTNKKKKKKKSAEDDTSGPVVPEVSKERFYKVETSLKSLFTSTATSADGDSQVNTLSFFAGYNFSLRWWKLCLRKNQKNPTKQCQENLYLLIQANIACVKKLFISFKKLQNIL